MAISDDYYTITQALKVLGVTRMTIHRRMESGKLNSEKVGRSRFFPKREVDYLGEKCPTCGQRIRR